jgi:hypothetical protein
MVNLGLFMKLVKRSVRTRTQEVPFRTSHVDNDRVHATLNALAYPFDHFQLDHFIAHVAQYRNKPILTLTIAFAPTLYGVWIPAKQRDYIFCNDSLQPIHQTHIILHEIAHMLLAHPLHRVDRVLPPDLRQELGGQQLMGRMRVAPTDHLMENREEQESERFVYLIQRQLVWVNRLAELTKESTSIEQLKPITDVMGYTER